MSKNTARRGRAIATTSWLALGVAMAWSPVMAQSTPAASDANGNTVADVVVVGARASQQSSIDRKKRAATPTDSIVADDVGSFPDRSITEAISRVAGTALSRNEFGEGQGVSIRGATMDQTRIELDGMGVQSTYGLALGTGDGGRAADMRELPADLIKSVDIVKGSTADQTEGSLSGGVKIQTRSGLDFKKPYLSFRLGAEQNSVDEKWTPDLNLVASRKFLDGRLGVIFNGSFRKVINVSHSQEVTGSNANDGFAVAWDWDNSPQKTYSFNPDLVGGPQGDVVLANSSETPRSLLTKSAAAQSKQDCLNTFPFLDTGPDPKNDYVVGNPDPVGGAPINAARRDALNSAANTAISTANNRKTERLNEQYTCLNQWNDLAPGNIRSFMKWQADTRKSADLRFDYRVSDNLTVFAKVNRSERITDDQNIFRALGNPDVNPTGRFFTTNGTQTVPAQRYVIQDGTVANPNPGAVGSGAGYFNWTLANLNPAVPASCPVVSSPGGLCGGLLPGAVPNPMIGRGATNGQVLLSRADQNQVNYTDDTVANGNIPVRGIVVNIDPASVKVDANHNVIAYTQYNNTASINQIDNYQPSITDYAQIGGDYSGERMRVEFMAGITKGSSSRVDFRTQWDYPYGKADLALSPAGVWDFTLPSTYDDSNPANFATFAPVLSGSAEQRYSATNPLYYTPPFTAAQQPNSRSYTVTMDPRIAETQEKQAKVDLTYDLADFSPFLTRFKTGWSYRQNEASRWANGGATIREAVGTFDQSLTLAQNVAQRGYVPAIILPGNRLSQVYRVCEETNISKTLDDGLRGTRDTGTGNLGLCNYGNVIRNPYQFSGVETFNQADFNKLLAANQEDNGMRFFNSYETSAPGWKGINTEGVIRSLEIGSHANFDCLKVCTASDGKVYEQPYEHSEEATTAAYAMLDFETENLPFGMTFNGNVGIRGVHTKTEGVGQMTVQNTVVTGRDANNNILTETRTYRQNVALTNQTNDWLPSYNANLWVIPDQVVVRYYYGKQISRPGINTLLPSGTCIIDERDNAGSQYFDGTDESNCSGTIGNPALKPQEAINQSVNLEWYPNRDTTVSLVWQKADIKTGGTRTVSVYGPVFAGTGITDARTGASLEDVSFRYNTFENAPGFERNGLEFTAKTAFTFLPWLFRYTGADFNYSTLKASTAVGGEFDPITGDAFDPRGQSAYYTNLSLWYDDGRAQVRVSYQARAETFGGISPISGGTLARNFPTVYNNGVAPPYYPGQPRFTDETKYLDAKASYNINDNVQVFLEGTNLTKQAQTDSTGGYRAFESGAPTLWRLSYSGMRVRTGVTFKFQ